MTFGNRLKKMIQEEGVSQKTFADEIDMSLGAIEGYIMERRDPANKFFVNIANNDKYSKYLVWLLTGKVNPCAGQICPAFSTQDMQDSVKKKA